MSTNTAENIITPDFSKSSPKTGGVAAEHLSQLIERIEKLELEKAQLAEHIRDVYAEAKHSGFDVKTMRTVIRLRKLQPQEREEQEHLLDLYKNALGLAV